MGVTDGLTEGDEGVDVNTLGGFEAAMAKLGVEPEEGDESSTDTSVANALTTAPAEEQTPDPPEATPAKTDTPAEAAPADTATEDPAVAAFLAKYDGDASKALKAAVEAQSVIGRQGQEMGTLREQIAELRGMVTAQAASATAAPPMTQEDAESRAAELVAEQGYHAAATMLVNESLKSGDSKAYDALLANWVLENPIAAQRYDLEFQLWKRDQDAPAPKADPTLSRVKADQEVNDIATTLGTLAQERGDAWASIAPHMDAAIDHVHPTVAALVASNDPDDRLAGARIVADRAAVLAAKATPAAPVKSAAEIAAEAATARKVAGSRVATGSLRPVTTEVATPEQRTEAIKAFKDELLGTADTSVARGLTYGNKR